MTIPNGAVFETNIAGGISLWDVSHLLTRHRRKRYGPRSESIERLFIHHSGAHGKGGFKGMEASARFVSRSKLLGGRDFPGFAYHYWFSHTPDIDSQGNIVIYRGQLDETEAWGTGGTNGNSVAAAFQGNSSKRPPTGSQIEMAEAFLPWWLERHKDTLGAQPLSFHGEAGEHGGRSKKTCPGTRIEYWLRGYRASI